MKDAMGIIYTGETDVGLNQLTQTRSIASVPLGGRYRIIDFILSNMVNSGIRNVGIITQNNYHSLIDHLDSGKQWDLDRKKDGLFILPPYVSEGNTGWYKGKVEALHRIMAYIRRSTQKYVVISGSHMVCNLVYDDALEFHKDRDADITVIYKEEKGQEMDVLRENTLIQTNNDGRIWDMEYKPAVPKSNNISMEMYIMEKSLLEYLVEECVSRGKYDFIMDLLIKNLNILKIYGYPYTGYLAKVDSIQAYFKHNMELLDPINRYELFFRSGPVYTKVKDEVPVKYGDDARLQNSMVADGCIINGEVENSVLFRGVKIAHGAQVKNSILMQDVEISEKVLLENVILDKNVVIKRGKCLIGQSKYPTVIPKGSVI